MEFLPEKIVEYAECYTDAENEVLAKLNRETWRKMVQPRMLSGHLQGRVLSMFSKMLSPMRILEIGTFTGYSAICMAEGLNDGGILTSIDVNEEFEDFARSHIEQAGMSDRIKLLIGDATVIIPTLNDSFDLVFIDADKENYSRYYDLVFDKVRQGGIIIADNVLWSGKVLEDESDQETMALKAYVEKVHSDQRVENLLLPVRDGLMICRKT
ncbi:MAG: O-methyltransferase [Vicingaceae bacterium]